MYSGRSFYVFGIQETYVLAVQSAEPPLEPPRRRNLGFWPAPTQHQKRYFIKYLLQVVYSFYGGPVSDTIAHVTVEMCVESKIKLSLGVLAGGGTCISRVGLCVNQDLGALRLPSTDAGGKGFRVCFGRISNGRDTWDL